MTKPDFIIIPMKVLTSSKIRQIDAIVYGAIYWYEKLKCEVCIAGNPAISEMVGIKENTLRSSLKRLEDAKFIKREYTDEKRKQRTQIKCLVTYSSDEKTEEKEEIKTIKKESPGDIARKFFQGDQVTTEEIIKSFEIMPKEILLKELSKFKLYWTTPTRSGKQQLWETKDTFEIKRRIYTWLNNAQRFSQSRIGAGAGVTV